MNKLQKTYIKPVLFFIALLIMPAQLWASASQGVIIAPTRVVFEGRDRSQIVRLVNPDSQPRRFRLSLVYIGMDDHGTRKIVDSPNSDEILAGNMIRFAPRQVTIPPDGWQTVRLMVRKPKGLAEGEYRVHLKLASIPNNEKAVPSESDKMPMSPGKVGIKINIMMNVTIPLIIRHGDGDVGVIPKKAILKSDIKTGGQFMEVELERTGSHSLFADVFLFADSDDRSNAVKLGEIKGITIYTPNILQYVNVPLVPDFPGNIQGKTIRVEIHDRERDTNTLMISKTLKVYKNLARNN